MHGGQINSSFRIGRAFGVDVRVHWAFLLLPGIFAIVGYEVLGGIVGGLVFAGIVAVVFSCVLLHEMGHAIVARRLGVGVSDVTLLPLGAIARLTSNPERHLDEAKIALAGPLVNCGLAFAFVGVAFSLGAKPSDAEGFVPDSLSVAQVLLYIGLLNAIFAILNLVPAFPLDGGKILRSLLASRFGYVKATSITANIGQYVAIVALLAAVFEGLLLLALIAVLLFFASYNEAGAVHQREINRGLSVADVMGTKRRTETITPYHNFGQVLDAVIHGYQEDFPVVDQDGTLVGIVTRDEIMTAAHSSDKFLTVRDLMKTDFPTLSPEDDLFKEGQRRLQESGMRALPVVRSGELVGMLTTEDIGQASTLRRYLGNS